MNYEYDDDAAGHADDFANRLDESGAYVGKFTKAESIVAGSGTKGIRFEVEVPGAGKAQFSLYTEKDDGSRIFGFNMVQGMMYLFGLKTLKTAPGKVMQYDEDQGKSVEVDGEVYPDLIGKDIGIVLQKELTTRKDGKDGYRMNLALVFHPTSRFTVSELKDRKAKPEKLEKVLKGLKNKDSREKRTPEPATPSAGAPIEGSY